MYLGVQETMGTLYLGWPIQEMPVTASIALPVFPANTAAGLV